MSAYRRDLERLLTGVFGVRLHRGVTPYPGQASSVWWDLEGGVTVLLKFDDDVWMARVDDRDWMCDPDGLRAVYHALGSCLYSSECWDIQQVLKIRVAGPAFEALRVGPELLLELDAGDLF